MPHQRHGCGVSKRRGWGEDDRRHGAIATALRCVSYLWHGWMVDLASVGNNGGDGLCAVSFTNPFAT